MFNCLFYFFFLISSNLYLSNSIDSFSSEYGEKWHKNGSADKRQNSFDDFQAAADYLIAEKYTNNKLLAIDGKASGGLLTGACLNQRPELYGAVVVEAGLVSLRTNQSLL